MFFKQKSNVLFRNYESFGYLTDNRNFGYKLTDNDTNVIGDKILSNSGAVFLSVLGRTPQPLDVLAKRIQHHFTDIDIRTIEKDAREFYCMLEHEGFIVSGNTWHQCEEKDTRFSYKIIDAKTIDKHFSSNIVQPEQSTQDFLEEYFKGKPQLTNVHIEITSKCNERCLHCYIPHDNKVSHINPELFYDVIFQCKTMRVLHLTLSGGEPMLHHHFCDFLRKCREYDFSVNVLSNLTLLNDEIITEMRANPLLGVQVSLYSMNSRIHDEITQMKGSFEKTRNAIFKLIDNDIPLQISCPILKQNKDCYEEVKNWAKIHKIHVGDDYFIIGRYNHSSQNLSSRLSIGEIQEMIKVKAVDDPKYLEQIELDAEKKKNVTAEDFICSVCHSSICISDNGDVYPCAGWQSYIVGNVQENSLIDIWDNSQKVQYLRGLRRNDFSKCLHCSDKDFCTMCMVRNANEDPEGNPLAVNEYFCKIAELNRKILIEYKENS